MTLTDRARELACGVPVGSNLAEMKLNIERALLLFGAEVAESIEKAQVYSTVGYAKRLAAELRKAAEKSGRPEAGGEMKKGGPRPCD